MNSAEIQEACALCEATGGEMVWQDDRCRVIRVEGREGADYPGFCRVVWQTHVREMTDLSAGDRQHLMRVVYAVESIVRALYRPDKINLASLGHLTPHLHWHVIPRWNDDPNFPAPIWAESPRRCESTPSIPLIARLTSVSTKMLHDRLLVVLASESKGSSV